VGIGSHGTYLPADPTAYTFVTQLDQVLEGAQESGIPYIGTPSSPGSRFGETVEGYRRPADRFNALGAAARARGMRFYVDPHSREFALENGTRLFAVLLDETDPRLVFFEMDIFWAYVGPSRFRGFKPHEYVWDQPERFPLVHVKDGIDYSNVPDVQGQFFDWDMTDVGDADIAFEPFFCGLDTSEHHFRRARHRGGRGAQSRRLVQHRRAQLPIPREPARARRRQAGIAAERGSRRAFTGARPNSRGNNRKVASPCSERRGRTRVSSTARAGWTARSARAACRVTAVSRGDAARGRLSAPSRGKR
jgi:hypothetical protein